MLKTQVQMRSTEFALLYEHVSSTDRSQEMSDDMLVARKSMEAESLALALRSNMFDVW